MSSTDSIFSSKTNNKHFLKKKFVLEDFIEILMCPNSKEKLSLLSRNELLQLWKNRTIELPEGKHFLINESKSFLYRFSPYGFPVLLPEEAIPMGIKAEDIPVALSDSQKISFETLKKHKENLETVYRKENYLKAPAGRTPERLAYEGSAVHKPVAENLKPWSVLDGGCGLGLFRHFTRGMFHLMLDVSEKNLSYNFAPHKVLGRTECIPIRDETFDNVVSLRSLEHCQHVQTSMAELTRCLKPGGRFLVACWREDWPACLRGSPWVYTNIVYFFIKAFILAKKNPKLFVDRALYKLKLKKTKSLEEVVLWDKDTKKIFSRRFNRDAFQKMLEKVGLKVLKKRYCGVETPGINLPKFITDRYFDSEKYGHFFYFVCEKS